MDRKSIIVIGACILLLLLWYPLVNKLYPPKPLQQGVTNSPATAESPVLTNAAGIPAPVVAVPPVKWAADTNAPETLLVVTNGDARYTFTSHGGGLKLIELVNFPEAVSRLRKKETRTNGFATLNALTAAPTLAVLDGDPVQGDGIFSLSRTASGVRAQKTLTNGLVLTKDFVLGTNYVITATVQFENHSTETLSLPPQEWVVGTATPMSAQDSGYSYSESVLWYNGAKTESVNLSYFNTNTTTLGIFPRVPRAEYRAGNNNIVWVSAQNQFFTIAMMLTNPAPALTVHMVDLPPPSREELMTVPRTVAAPRGLQAELNYPALTLAPGQVIAHTFTLFAGPKEYRTLARLAAQFNNDIDRVMGFNGFFGFFSKGLLLAMNWLHDIAKLSYGWAIVAITLIIKLLFWPLTQASTRSMKRMQALQPQMKAIAEKYKDDSVKKNQKTMEFMKENKVNPMGGCLPMLLQMPVLFGFFYMIRSAIELRGAPFLWAGDLSKPDTLFIIPGLNFPFNLLPLLMSGVSVWQAHLTPPSPGMDPMQQKMMRYMPLITVVIFYNMASGLTLYYTVQSLLTVVQTKLTRMQPSSTPPSAPVLTSPPKKRK